MATLRERLKATVPPVYGRDGLLDELTSWASHNEAPVVTYLHGLAGIGKSTVAAALVERTRSAGGRVLEIECGAVQPTESGVLNVVATLTGRSVTQVSAIGDALDSHEPLLVVLDDYDAWRLLDSWVRRELVPALPANTRILICGRDRPSGPWLFAPEWRTAFRPIELAPIDGESAIAFLTSEGLPPEDAARVQSMVGGHPLALALALSTLRDNAQQTIDAAVTEGVLAALVQMYLDAVPDRITRAALEAAAVTRRTTESVLAAQLSDEDAPSAYQKLERLPFVRAGWDGLAVHEAVKSALAMRLRSTDPRKHLRLRRAAWRQLQTESRDSGTRELWRYTSDMMYLLLDQPILREGFFPSAESPVVIDPARPEDVPTIRALELSRSGPEAAAILDRWLEWQLDAFGVARNRAGEIVGFKCATTSDRLDPRLREVDPIVAAWLADLASSPAPDEPAFMLRRWQSRNEGEGPGDAQAACWIDCKREYMARRPHLGHIYVSTTQTDFYLPFLSALGFTRVPGTDVLLDGQLHRSVANRLGVGSVDGWLSRLVAAELGIDPHTLLDESARQLVVSGSRVPLTPLEFGVMRCLIRRQGEAVSRADLVEEVWGYQYTGESNVEAVVIRGLRSKLGDRASMIETVRGYGYRLSDDLPAETSDPTSQR